MKNRRRSSSVVFGILQFFASSMSLELLELRVPSHVPLGTRATLQCRWQLAPSDVLYSVKWYKDGKEFFRHVPRDMEPRRKFPLPGVDVEKSDESGSKLTLSPAVLETGGRYCCEVSGERPLFPTVSDHADMLVVALPSEGPVITGFQSQYGTGDRVHITCTSGPSRPAAKLSWYVNGEPTSPLTLTHEEHGQTDDALETTRLSLDMVLTDDHFRDDVLKVKCLATLGALYWRSNEESAQKIHKVRTYDVKSVKHYKMNLDPRPEYRSHASRASILNYTLIISGFSEVVLRFVFHYFHCCY